MKELSEYESYQPKQWVEEIINWITDISQNDQEAEGKTKFVKTALVGPITRLSAFGKSNPLMRKKSKEFFTTFKDQLSLKELLLGLDYIYQNIDYTEAHMFIFYSLENFKNLYNRDKLGQEEFFNLINNRWVDRIDHWTSSDHLCINGVRHMPVYEDKFTKEINKWVNSDNFWKQRLSIVIYIKHIKGNKVSQDLIIQNITKLIDTKNYYIRKSIPWLLREISKVDPIRIETFVRENIDKISKTELREASRALDNSIQVELIDLYLSNK